MENEYKALELSDEELAQVSGGAFNTIYYDGIYYDDTSNVGTTYTDDHPDGIIRNPGDKYFGDR